VPWLVPLAAYWLASPLPRAALEHRATLDELGGALVRFTTGSAVLLQRSLPLDKLGLALGACLLAAGWLAGGRDGVRGLRLIITLAALVFLVPAGLSMATGRWLFVPHFMVFLLPALFVVCGLGAVRLYDRLLSGRSRSVQSERRAARWLGLLGPGLAAVWVVAMLSGLGLYYRYPPHGADGLREMAALLRRDARPGDLVVVTPPALAPTLEQYYPGEIRGLPDDFDLRRVYLPYTPQEWRDMSLERLFALASDRSRLWLVYHRHPELDPEEALLNAARQSFRQVSAESYPYAQLFLFEIR
jgi:hypothetical protein